MKTNYAKAISEIEKEFSLYLAKSEGSEKELEDENKESSKEANSEEEKEAVEGEEQGEKDVDSKVEDEAEGHDYDDKDIEELHKMYGGMNKAELELHKKACDHHYANKCGEMEKCGEMITKSGKDGVVKLGGELKIEKDVALLKSENQDLKKSVEDLLSAMTSFVSKKAPARKAITEISVIEKSDKEPAAPIKLSATEITKILSKKTMEPTLSKSDRDLIDNYCYKKVGVDAIAHLLK